MKRVISICAIIFFMTTIYIFAQHQIEYGDTDEKTSKEDLYSEKPMEKNYEKVITKEKDEDELWVQAHAEDTIFEGEVTQEDVLRIAQLKNLKRLDMVITESEIDLSYLSNLTQLEELSIYFVRGTNHADLSFIKELDNLTSIFIDRSDGNCDLSLFEDMRELRELYVKYLTDVDLQYLSNCRKLKEIEITGEHIRNIDGLSNLSQLESLYLSDDYRYEDDKDRMSLELEALSDLSQLKALYLVRVSVNDVSPLSNLRNLEFIILVNTGIKDIKPLSNLERLKNFEIFGNRDEEVVKQAEMYMKHVESVTVTNDIPYGF